MKGYTQAQFEAEKYRINTLGTLDIVTFCLKRLYADEQHSLPEEVVCGLTFEELLNALLCAQDKLVYFSEAE